MIGHVTRPMAFAIALAAMFDPPLTLQRSKPVAVEFVTSSSDGAARVRAELLRALEDEVLVAQPGHGDAVVAIDRGVDVDAIRDRASVSFITFNGSPNVRLASASIDGTLFPGERGLMTVRATVHNAAGQRAKVKVLQDGVELGATERIWADAAEQQFTVPLIAVSPGSHRLTVIADPLPEEQRQDDNVLEVNVTTSDRRSSIAFIEPRPSWSARFVRQALETDPRVTVSSLTRASLGVEIRTARPPSNLTVPAIYQFDLLAIGAPEELRDSDVTGLRRFMTDRGGTVVLLPDRRPAGAVTTLIPAADFEEALFSNPLTLSVSGAGKGLPASEFAVPRAPVPSMQTLAMLPDGRSAVMAWPIGTGTLIVSGALDAWRYRSAAGGAFASFWRGVIVGRARQAPPAVDVEVNPAVLPLGAAARVTARVRRTEFQREGSTTRFPPISAVAIGQRNGTTHSEFIRLWPAIEPGVYRGEFVPSEDGAYTVHVRADSAEAAAALLTTDSPAGGIDEGEAAIISAATGGVMTTGDQLDSLVTHLRGLRRDRVATAIHPMRSGWWILPFAIALTTEWTIRRRSGRA